MWGYVTCCECKRTYHVSKIRGECTNCQYMVCLWCSISTEWFKGYCGMCDHNSCINCNKLCKNCNSFHCTNCHVEPDIHPTDDCYNMMTIRKPIKEFI